MISLLIALVIFALVVSLLWWLIQMIPLPQPVRVVITVLFCLVCIVYLLQRFNLASL